MKTSAHRISIANEGESTQLAYFLTAARRIGVTKMIDVGVNIEIFAIVVAALPSVARVAPVEADPDTTAEPACNVALRIDGERFEVHRGGDGTKR